MARQTVPVGTPDGLDEVVAALFSLRGRVAIVTGAGRGLGAGIAELLARAGCHVVVADIVGDLAAATATALTDGGWSAEAVPLDVSDRAAVDAAVDAVVARHGRLDVMVNNAGVIFDATPLDVTDDDLDRVFGVNFRGVVHGSQAAARHMVAAGGGSIVNVTSGAVDMAMGWVASYSTSKAAAHQFTRSLALQLAPRHVRVNAVAPGWVLTPMNERHLRDESERQALIDERVATIPLGRAGTERDIAASVLFLASDASSFTTGSTLRPNGGMTMPW